MNSGPRLGSKEGESSVNAVIASLKPNITLLLEESLVHCRLHKDKAWSVALKPLWGRPSIPTHLHSETLDSDTWLFRPSPQNTAVPKLNTAEIPTSSRTRTFLKWVKVRVSSEWGGFGMEGFPQ